MYNGVAAAPQLTVILTGGSKGCRGDDDVRCVFEKKVKKQRKCSRQQCQAAAKCTKRAAQEFSRRVVVSRGVTRALQDRYRTVCASMHTRAYSTYIYSYTVPDLRTGPAAAAWGGGGALAVALSVTLARRGRRGTRASA